MVTNVIKLQKQINHILHKHGEREIITILMKLIYRDKEKFLIKKYSKMKIDTYMKHKLQISLIVRK